MCLSSSMKLGSGDVSLTWWPTDVLYNHLSNLIYWQTNIDVGDAEHSGSPEGQSILSKQEERKEYNLCVLKQVQAIFGHLAESKLQYYIPRGFWKHFK